MREPVLLWEAPDGVLTLIDGHHRLEAYARAGHSLVPSIVLRGVSIGEAFRVAGKANAAHKEGWNAQDRLRFVKRGIVEGFLIDEGHPSPLTNACANAALILGKKVGGIERAVQREAEKNADFRRAVEKLKDASGWNHRRLKLTPQELNQKRTAKKVRQAGNYLKAATDALRSAGLKDVRNLGRHDKSTLRTVTGLSDRIGLLLKFQDALVDTAGDL
jgi:ParB-like chromosome segregation protein Spo0J